MKKKPAKFQVDLEHCKKYAAGVTESTSGGA